MSDIDALERRARALLPRAVYDFYDSGAGREATLRANVEAWRRCWLRPHVLRDVTSVSTSVTLPGLAAGPLRTPIAVAPTGFQGHAHPEGEVASARGAAMAGALYVLSTRSSRRIEDVAEAVAQADGQWWFQVYVMRDRELTAGLVRRAAAAGAAALVLTADTPVVGRKRRGQGDTVVTDEEFLVNLGPIADLTGADQSPDVTFGDIGALADLSGGLPVVVKGVLRPDDARACVAAGAAGVVVSNHGGRQLDGAVPTALALPEVAAALAAPDDGPAVFVDGGLRSAEDAATALALGARMVFLGRPVLWALACGGAEGVRDLLAGLTADLAGAMALAGVTSVSALAHLATAGRDRHDPPSSDR